MPSQMPWGHRRGRRWLGRVGAYWKTVLAVIRRPGILAREACGPVCRRDAVGFHRVSVIVATVMGSGAIAGAFRFRVQEMPSIEPGSYWITPVAALMDSCWGLVPLGLGVFLGVVLGLGYFRALLRWGTGRGVMRGRTGRAALYASALAVVEAVFLGLAYVAVASPQSEAMRMAGWMDYWRAWLQAGAGVLAAAGLVIYGVVAMVALAKARRLTVVRAGAALAGLPLTLAVFVVLLAGLFWGFGYVAMAVYSMTH
jgi:hypothetical protein